MYYEAPHVKRLRGRELEVAVEWFLDGADGSTRRALMAMYPQTYAKLYPHVDMAVILSAVADELVTNLDPPLEVPVADGGTGVAKTHP